MRAVLGRMEVGTKDSFLRRLPLEELGRMGSLTASAEEDCRVFLFHQVIRVMTC
jgi:hypothetical protein